MAPNNANPNNWQIPPVDQKCPNCCKAPFEGTNTQINDYTIQVYTEYMRKYKRCWNCGYDYIQKKVYERITSNVLCPKCGEVIFSVGDSAMGPPFKDMVYQHLNRTIRTCSHCGYDFSDYDFYTGQGYLCSVCGGELVKDPTTGKKVCSQCGADYIKKEVTIQETDKKCPCCGATINFNPATGKLHCDYCGYDKDLPLPGDQKEISENDFFSAINTESYEWGAEKKSVECKNCGAVSIYDALETAAVCPFCGSNQVMPAATANTIAPGGVCPFTVTKETAVNSFKTWLKKKLFTPRKAKQSADPEAFKGVYLPYWTYDAQTRSSFTARAGFDRKVRKKDGTYETETTWRYVNGVYDEFIDDQTVMASKRHEDSGVKRCEPFELKKLVPYDPKLLAGFVAERYSIGLKDGWDLAQISINVRLKDSITDYVKKYWRCDRVQAVKFTTHYSDMTYKYILVPVWLSSFQYKNKTYQFAVNGQTGKVGGDAPVSAFRVILAILLGIGVIWGIIALCG